MSVTLDKNGLVDFAGSIPARVGTNRDKIITAGDGTWDSRARKSFGEALVAWFSEDFGLSKQESTKYIYVEGSNTIPPRFRSASFFSSKVYPDSALILGNETAIAIELDHGSKGSGIKNALSKAGFAVKLGGYDRALVLFFVDPPKTAADFQPIETEKQILSLYEEQFQTTLHII